MNSLRVAAVLALCAGALAACNKPAAGGAASGAAAGSASAPAAAAPGPITAADMPRPRAGAWTMSDADDPHSTPDRLCYLDQPLRIKTPAFCSKFQFSRTLTGIAVDAECGKNGLTNTMHITADGDFQSRYTSTIQMSFVLRPGEPPHTSTTHMVYTYAGACTPQEKAEAERNQADADRIMSKDSAN